jgi:Protein involved in initiation of plasmid replication
MDGKPKGRMVVKANKLVQAKMPLSKLEHRVVAMLISQLDKNDKEFGFQRLYIKDLQEAFDKGRAGSLYQRAENICQSLLDKKIEVKTKEDGKRVYDGINLMNRCKYKEGDGYIEAKFNEEMKEYLLQLKRRFTMYEAGYYIPLRSTHSMRIYELLKMREGISVLRVSVEEFRDILGLMDSYEYFSALKAHVIEKAQEEIRAKTDISFTYDVEREGRTAKRLKFFIHSGEDRPEETTKVEDRTEAPDIDVISMFKADLSQEELDSLNEETVQSLHEKALKQAQTENPDGAQAMLQAETYRHMKRLWAS